MYTILRNKNLRPASETELVVSAISPVFMGSLMIKVTLPLLGSMPGRLVLTRPIFTSLWEKTSCCGGRKRKMYMVGLELEASTFLLLNLVYH